MIGQELQKTESCESCGESNFLPNWLPEGQCFCCECAADYWMEDDRYDNE